MVFSAACSDLIKHSFKDASNYPLCEDEPIWGPCNLAEAPAELCLHYSARVMEHLSCLDSNFSSSLIPFRSSLFSQKIFLCPVIIFSAGLNSFLSVCGVYKAHIKLHEYTGLKQLPNPEKCIFLVWQLKRQAKYR